MAPTLKPGPLEFDPSINAAVPAFISTFYQVGDTPHANEEYADLFTEDGVAVVFANERAGRQEILEWRKGAWDFVISRSHIPVKVYTKGANEFAILGVVSLGFKDGTSDGDDFVAFMEVKEVEGEMKIVRYESRGLN